jgi:hypothetical protein
LRDHRGQSAPPKLLEVTLDRGTFSAFLPLRAWEHRRIAAIALNTRFASESTSPGKECAAFHRGRSQAPRNLDGVVPALRMPHEDERAYFLAALALPPQTTLSGTWQRSYF